MCDHSAPVPDVENYVLTITAIDLETLRAIARDLLGEI